MCRCVDVSEFDKALPGGVCERRASQGSWASGAVAPNSSAVCVCEGGGGKVRRGGGGENSMRTLFLFCFPRNRTARFCPVCIPVASPPGALPPKEGLPLPPVSLAGFLRPLLRGMPARQEDTGGQGLWSLHCPAEGPASALSVLPKDRTARAHSLPGGRMVPGAAQQRGPLTRPP